MARTSLDVDNDPLMQLGTFERRVTRHLVLFVAVVVVSVRVELFLCVHVDELQQQQHSSVWKCRARHTRNKKVYRGAVNLQRPVCRIAICRRLLRHR